jgi:transcriptional regulator with XRE-family HTH domain
MNVVQNIKEIRLKKGINQDIIADALDFDIANWSRIENGKQELKVDHLEKIANVLNVAVIDLFTYPEVYVNRKTIEEAERISVTFEVSPDKRDILLSLVTKKEN